MCFLFNLDLFRNAEPGPGLRVSIAKLGADPGLQQLRVQPSSLRCPQHQLQEGFAGPPQAEADTLFPEEADTCWGLRHGTEDLQGKDGEES